MLWETWLASIAPVFGLTTAQAGVVLGLLITLIFALAGGVLQPDHVVVSMGIPTLLGLILFTYANWLPTWTGSALAIVIAGLIAGKISGKV